MNWLLICLMLVLKACEAHQKMKLAQFAKLKFTDKTIEVLPIIRNEFEPIVLKTFHTTHKHGIEIVEGGIYVENSNLVGLSTVVRETKNLRGYLHIRGAMFTIVRYDEFIGKHPHLKSKINRISRKSKAIPSDTFMLINFSLKNAPEYHDTQYEEDDLLGMDDEGYDIVRMETFRDPEGAKFRYASQSDNILGTAIERGGGDTWDTCFSRALEFPVRVYPDYKFVNKHGKQVNFEVQSLLAEASIFHKSQFNLKFVLDTIVWPEKPGFFKRMFPTRIKLTSKFPFVKKVTLAEMFNEFRFARRSDPLSLYKINMNLISEKTDFFKWFTNKKKIYALASAETAGIYYRNTTSIIVRPNDFISENIAHEFGHVLGSIHDCGPAQCHLYESLVEKKASRFEYEWPRCHPLSSKTCRNQMNHIMAPNVNGQRIPLFSSATAIDICQYMSMYTDPTIDHFPHYFNMVKHYQRPIYRWVSDQNAIAPELYALDGDVVDYNPDEYIPDKKKRLLKWSKREIRQEIDM